MTRGDYVVVALALALLPWLYVTHWTSGAPGDTAHVLDGTGHEVVVPLDTDRRMEIAGPLGDSVIEVRDGSARFASSPCRGKQCVHAGWLKDGGDFTACLPNRISLAIAGVGGRYDSINF